MNTKREGNEGEENSRRRKLVCWKASVLADPDKARLHSEIYTYVEARAHEDIRF